MQASVRARPGRDCALRLRRHYRLPVPFSRDDADLLPNACVDIVEFSLMVAGARDHMRLRLEPGVELAGVLGEHEIVVTYGKFGGLVPPALIAAVERRICTRWGPIEWDTEVPTVTG